MIESIEIKNFRCFKDTKIAKFGLVNLFGGMNNAGKTALLEAVYLTASPTPSSLIFLHKVVRKENAEFGKEKPENVWDNLFFEQNKEQEITFSCITTNTDTYEVVLSNDQEVDDLIRFVEENSDDEEINEIHSALSEKATIKSALHFHVHKNSDDKECAGILVASKSGIVGRGSPSNLKFDNAHFIPSSIRLSVSDLAKEYEKARFNEKEAELLSAFKIVDETIEKMEVFSIGESVLYLKRENEKKMPISLFGDAMNRVADFVLRIINNPNSIILIDEIENGIHHTAQAELWEMLFKLANAYDTQIFATTHSSEMIKSFEKVAQEFSDKAAYFELAKHAKTGNIIGSSIPMDILNYDIKNHAPYRGE